MGEGPTYIFISKCLENMAEVFVLFLACSICKGNAIHSDTTLQDVPKVVLE